MQPKRGLSGAYQFIRARAPGWQWPGTSCAASGRTGTYRSRHACSHRARRSSSVRFDADSLELELVPTTAATDPAENPEVLDWLVDYVTERHAKDSAGVPAARLSRRTTRRTAARDATAHVRLLTGNWLSPLTTIWV